MTVTADAVVRLWEFDEGNRWSSDNASLAIDLKKLALGVSSEENFQPERGRNRSFSSDTIGMEVSSACFGGANLDEESPWSSLTLWVAMKAGDVYALCPLLPSKWQPCATMIPALSTAIIAESSVPGDEMDIRSQDSQQRQSQYKWIQELDGQEPVHITSNTEPGSEVEIYARPEHPAIIPRLQGPFQLLADETEDIELSDVHVIAAKSNFDRTSADDDSEEAFEPDEYGLSASVICLLARSGRCYICLDLEGVQGQWLPRRENTGSDEDSMQSTLIVLEGLDTLDPSGDKPMERPTISPDVDSRYSFFMTHSKGVYFFSLEPWLSNLERELQSEDGSGVSFRLDIFRNGPGTLRESILSFNSLSATNGNCTVPACVLLDDSDLGYFLLTTHECQPQAAILDRPYSALIPTLDTADDELSVPDLASLALGPSRTPYQPPAAFYGGSSLPSFIETHVQARHRHLASQQIRLSSATLDVMTETHRLLSHETHQQGLAAADLFRRCERLVEELQDQVSRVAECAERTQRIIEDEGDRYLDDIEGKARRDTGNLVLEERVQHVRDKQVQLHDRFEGLKKKLHGGGGKPLSEKEKSWAKEVLTTAKAVGVDQNDESDEQHDLDDAQAEKDTAKTNGHRDEGGTPEIEGSEETGRRDESTMRQRSQQIQQIKTDLIDRTDDVLADSQPDQRQPEGKNDATDDPPRDADIDSGIPKDLRAKKIDQVMQLLDRECVIPPSDLLLTMPSSSIVPLPNLLFHSQDPTYSSSLQPSTDNTLLCINDRSSMIQAASQRLERLILATSTTTA